MPRKQAPRALAALLVAVLAGCAHITAAVAAPTITEYEVPTKDLAPSGIAAGPDGNLWFGLAAKNGVGISSATGTIAVRSGLSGPTQAVTAGPDGNLWFTEPLDERVVRITPLGVFTEYPVAGEPSRIAAGPDGALWFTIASNPGAIGRIDPTTAKVSEFTAGLTPNRKPTGITAGPDGAMWFTEATNPGAIGRITTSGAITEYKAGLTTNSRPLGIAAGPDGALWFTQEANPGAIGRIATDGTISEFTAGLSTNSQPTGIAAADDGNLHFTEAANPGRIGAITPAGIITEQATPTNNSLPWGISEGPDGNVWFTEIGAHGQIGMQTVAPGTRGTGAEDVAEQVATLNAEVRPNAQATTTRFEYGPTTAYGTQTAPFPAGSGSSYTPVSADVGGLAAGATYHFRVTATNSTGTTYGPDATFMTQIAPEANTLAVSGVSAAGATLQGSVDPHGRATSYHFDWGTTSAYGNELPLSDEAVGSDSLAHAVAQRLASLQPAASYHYRLVASNCGGCAEGTSYGGDVTFTTATAASSPPITGEAAGLGAGPTPLAPGSPPSPVAPPALGRTAVMAVVSGVVTVTLPGASRPEPLSSAGDIPVGSVVDASHGVLSLTTAVDHSGRTQSATVWGQAFALSQSASHGGMTTMTLNGSAGCRARGRRAASAARSGSSPAPRTLWAKDNHGHFSTRGQNSVATVRGTYWGTQDRCQGTLTIVRRGAVSVRDLRHHRTVLVKAGHSYLARR